MPDCSYDVALFFMFILDELSRRREFQETTEKADNTGDSAKGKFIRAYFKTCFHFVTSI